MLAKAAGLLLSSDSNCDLPMFLASVLKALSVVRNLPFCHTVIDALQPFRSYTRALISLPETCQLTLRA
jgi:hypothetical protein